jgi:hypothetical protein
LWCNGKKEYYRPFVSLLSVITATTTDYSATNAAIIATAAATVSTATAVAYNPPLTPQPLTPPRRHR